MEEFRFQIAEDMEDERIDKCVSMLIDSLSRSYIQKMIKEGRILVNEKPVKGSYRAQTDDEVAFFLPPSVEPDIEPENIPLDIVYEDEDLLVINKPKGLVVHPAAGHQDDTLVNGLLYHCGDSLSGVGGVKRPGIVHRIDRDTSGLLCVAKNDMAHGALSAQLSDHTMHREDRTLVIGGLPAEKGTVNAPIARHPVDRKKMAVSRDGKHAVTHYTSLGKISGITDCSVVLETGRTHQIRVHMAYIGHPVLGDPVYGGENHPFVKKHPALFHGQMLHAAALVLIHPATGEKMRFTCGLPDYYTEALRLLTESET